ncbi:MAG: hypothetical protein WDZ72_00180 [Cyclobacteriaceae bacterium]
MYLSFEEMPKSSRIWIYQSDRPFSEQEKTLIIAKLVAFCNQWHTHGTNMPSSFDLQYDQFIILAVDESGLGASGCSIDSSIRILREIESELNVNLLDSGKISYLCEDQVKVAFLPDIKKHILQGQLQKESDVFNPSVNTIADLEENWLIPARDSWLKRYFAQ